MDELTQVRNCDLGAEPGQGVAFCARKQAFSAGKPQRRWEDEGSPAGGSQGAAEPQFLGGALP